MRRLRRHRGEEAELDITSFMNLMIVLVPVLLLSLVFSQVRILNLQLPVSAAGESPEQEQSEEEKQLELVITKDSLYLNYPAGVLLKTFDLSTDEGQTTRYNFVALSSFLQDLKLTFQQKNIEKSDIVILLSPDVNYQSIVTAMDTVRSFKAVVAANLVNAELFPNISLGDAPIDDIEQVESSVAGGDS
ncbi:biopolymer transporter ExbD [Colwellia sp. RE-S-Sl-9]